MFKPFPINLHVANVYSGPGGEVRDALRLA